MLAVHAALAGAKRDHRADVLVDIDPAVLQATADALDGEPGGEGRGVRDASIEIALEVDDLEIDGLGREAITAINQQDLPVIIGIVLFASAVVVVARGRPCEAPARAVGVAFRRLAA